MKNTVLSFNNAVSNGHEPREYSYQREDIPLGTYEVHLDFMIWAKKQMAVNCYCTVTESNSKVILPVYRNANEQYIAGALEIGFVSFNTKLRVTVELRGQRGVNLKEVVVV